MDLKFDEFNEERKNKRKALTSGYLLSGTLLILPSLEAPFIGSPRVTSETDASDSETEDIVLDDIAIFESSSTLAIPTSRNDNLSISSTSAATVKRTTTLKPPGRESIGKFPTFESTTPPPVKENPRKRRRSELFSSSSNNNKENISTLPPGSDLFSPTTIQRTNEKVQRGVLAESSPPRPSLLIPAGLTRLESPNKPMNVPIPMDKFTSKDVLELIALDEEGGGRRASRTRKQVNYALPNLRDKMRREDNVDEKGRRRSKSLDRSVTPDQGVVWTLIILLK